MQLCVSQEHTLNNAQGLMVSKILSILSQTRVSLSHEKTSQEEIEHALTRGGISFIREHRLSAKDIPDFILTALLWKSNYAVIKKCQFLNS